MSALKPVLMVGVLAVIGYVTYISINQGPAPEPPPGAPTEWAQPDVQFTAPGTTMGTPVPAVPVGSEGAPPRWPASPAPLAPAPASEYSSGSAMLPNPVQGSPAPPYGSDVTPPPLAMGAQPASNPGPIVQPSSMQATPVDAAQGNTLDVGAALSAQAGSGNQDPLAFATAMTAAQNLLDTGKVAEAHLELSAWYDEPRLSTAEQRELNELLDRLAGNVLYSRDHVLESAYQVQPGDRLQDIAAEFKVPWQLLAKINGIDDPDRLYPGEKLKVIRGPFVAVVSLEKRELTLMLEDSASHKARYAGRFPIVELTLNGSAPEGRYRVQEKRSLSEAADARLIAIGNNMGIYGAGESGYLDRTAALSGVQLSSRDISDVYDMLSEGSQVIIRR